MINKISCASLRIMLLFPDRSLITNCSVYLCNSCNGNVDSYKVVINMLAGNNILYHAILNWCLNNVQDLTSEIHALQLDQLSEQILFLLDCVRCTLQSNVTNFHTRFELQLN